MLRRRSVQAGLAVLLVPAAWGTYRLAVPHYQGRPISYWLGTLGDAAVTDPDAFCGQHIGPPQSWAFLAMNRMDRVAEVLDDPDPLVRAGACRVLAGIGEVCLVGEKRRNAITKLIALLRDTDPRVRFHAAFALGASGDAVAVEPLLNAIQAADADARLKSVAATSISWLTEEPDALDAARRAWLDSVDDPAARAHALRAVYWRGGPLWSPAIEDRSIRLLGEPLLGSDAAAAPRWRFRVYFALLRPPVDQVDVRVAQALLRDLCGEHGPDDEELAALWLADAANGMSEALARAVRAALAAEGPGAHDCPLVRRGQPCGREVRSVKRLLGSGD